MVIQHNLSAMNANRQLGLSTAVLAKTTEKLASGYRVNRSADDAAGLAISEKMRRQIRGLSQASRNAQDGISMVQTAEGAMNEAHDMLQRMNELCVQAANGTMTSEDRSYTQYEIDELIDELDRIGTTTTFNEIALLDGLPPNAVGANTPQISGISASFTPATDDTPASYTVGSLQKDDVIGITNNAGKITYYKVDGTPDPEQTYDGKSPGTAYNISKSAMYNRIATAILESNNDHEEVEQVSVNYSASDTGDISYSISFYGPLHVSLQVGAEPEDTLDIKLNEMNAGSLGVGVLNVKDYTGASASIGQVKSAIESLSSQRSYLGAVQNRLEHKIRNLDNIIENTTTAESLIRDADMASLMVKFSNNNILTQVGQAILSQANQSKNGVLSLLS